MTKIKVLYVEDEIFLGKIVRESLETRNFEVAMETDGAAVLSAFRASRPDVCILDVMLPNKDGFTIAEEIRAIDSAVPIIFVTAKTQTNDLVKGFSIGANDYIRKPFSMEELIVRIDNALKQRNGQRHREVSDDQLRVGKYLFHLNRQMLVAGNEEKKLSFRESELLKILYHNRDRVIDRKDILNLLWGNDSFFNSRNLDVYITKLRGYLKADESIEILTIKGIGYRFIIA
jgi:DNA-binding response OmpR family regulator